MSLPDRNTDPQGESGKNTCTFSKDMKYILPTPATPAGTSQSKYYDTVLDDGEAATNNTYKPAIVCLLLW